MKNKNSIIRTFFVSFSVVITLFMIIFGGFWVWSQSRQFQKESETIRLKYIESQKELIRSQVQRVVDYVRFIKSQSELRLKTDVKFRTEEAYGTAHFLYTKYKTKWPDEKIKKLIFEALYAASWDEGRGYYFIEDMQGVELLNRNNPELVGKSIIDIQDGKGTFIMRDILQVVKSAAGEGYTTYYWNKPSNPSVLSPKISYVKHFKPFDWVIGSGKYLEDEEQILKKEVLDRISDIRFGENNYVFASTMKGVSLVKPFAGQNMIHVEDSNGVKIVQELISAARSGGGFVEYVMPKYKGLKPYPKLSYAAMIPDWDWYVGAGVYIDEIEKVIAERQMQFQSKIVSIVKQVMAMFLVLLLASLIVTWWMFNKFNEHMNIFANFFLGAAEANPVKIDLEELEYYEFVTLGESANKMIDLREQALHDLAESEKRFLKVVELAPTPIVITTSDGRMEYINKQYIELFGYEHEEIRDVQTWMSLAYPDPIYREQVEKVWINAIAKTTSESEAFETDIIKVCKASGEFLDVKFFYTPVGDRGLTLAYNMTEMLRSEEERAVLQQQLHQAQKMEAIGMMAGGVAHDLNNILSGVVSYPELLLLKLPENSDLRAPLKSIHESGLRAAEVVADLLTVARGVASEKKVIDLNDIVREHCQSPEFVKLKERFPSIEIDFTHTESPLYINCSAVHVKKTIMNLMSNAAESISDNGVIKVTLLSKNIEDCSVNHQRLEAGDYVVLQVTDNGSGIDKKDLEHIFEPFYSKKVMGYSGTGLGLSIVWNTMLDHHGAVDVVSGGDGTTFNLYFPMNRNYLFVEPEAIEPGEVFGKGESILIVDDEKLQRDIASEILSTIGYKTYTVDSGESAIDFIETMPVDLIILDMIMKPGLSGSETYAQIIKKYPNQKAIIASGFSADADVRKAQEMGAGAYIKKPYTLSQLGNVVKIALASTESSHLDL